MRQSRRPGGHGFHPPSRLFRAVQVTRFSSVKNGVSAACGPRDVLLLAGMLT